MEMKYPYIIVIGLIVLIVLAILFKFKKTKYNNGRKIANTEYIKKSKIYKEKVKRYNLYLYIIDTLCVLTIISALLLATRFSKEEVKSNEIYNRDIMLCMDVSTSVDPLNKEVVDSLREILKSLKGERFGISVFNSSSILLSPLTDDYSFIESNFEKLNKSFDVIDEIIANNYYYSRDKYYEQKYYVDFLLGGTDQGNQNGSSLTGDGLASCVYAFNNFDQERTRIIIFTTDNEVLGTPVMNLNEAAKLVKEKNIYLYTIGTKNMGSGKHENLNPEEELKNATLTANGKFYKQGELQVSQIVKEINKTSKTKITSNPRVLRTDVPKIPFIIMLSLLALLILVSKGVRR